MQVFPGCESVMILFEIEALGHGDGAYSASKKSEKVALRQDSLYISIFSPDFRCGHFYLLSIPPEQIQI
jgi:hypothetical protein